MTDVVKLKVKVGAGDSLQELTVRGRDAWALGNLMEAGEVGCTPIDHPGPRWSHYVFKLRRAGIAVETIDERHSGSYSGTHARYVLRSRVEVMAREYRA